jgi:hypothetical protein
VKFAQLQPVQCLGSNRTGKIDFRLSILLRKNQNHCLSINTEALGNDDTKTFSVPLYLKSIIQLYHFSQTKLYTNEILFLLLFVIQTQAQQGGMWIPSFERNE